MRNIFVTLLFFLTLTFFVGAVNAVQAATLQFDPASASLNVGDTTSVSLKIDAGSDQIRATDIYILYDPSLVDITVGSGTYFPSVQNNTNTAGRLFIGAGDPNAGSFKTGGGTVATLSIKAKTAGTSTISFDCQTGSTSETNIYKNDADATDVIDCTQSNKATLTIGGSGSGGSTSTPTPVVGGSSSDTTVPTISVLPQTGGMTTTNNAAVVGIILVLIGGSAKLLFFKKYQ